MWGSTSAGIPGPLSATSMSTSDGSRRIVISTATPFRSRVTRVLHQIDEDLLDRIRRNSRERRPIYINDVDREPGGPPATPGAGAMSSYDVSGSGALQVLSGSVPDHGSAPCWVVITKSGRYAYTTNTGSGTISSYRIAADGTLTLLEAVAGVTGAGTAPIDMALSRDGGYLYTLSETTGEVYTFRIRSDGGLEPLGTTSADALAAFGAGLAAR